MQNRLFFTIDLVKKKLDLAYKAKDEPEMSEMIIDIIDLCNGTGNRHFQWFARLLTNHFEGIIAYVTFKISKGKIEGINQKIKTIRRKGCCYPDDEYLFLKIFDSSRRSYVRNTPSHKICD